MCWIILREEFDRISLFILVGAIGFLTDAGILSLLFHYFDWGHVPARGVSFPTAVIITWLLNRHFTFSRMTTLDKGKEGVLYFVIQTTGALLNLFLYLLLIETSQTMNRFPVMALAIGAIAALLSNYTLSRALIYKRRPVG